MNEKEQSHPALEALSAGGVSNPARMHVLICACIVLAGAFVRFHGLDAESIDLEEYACLSAVDAPSFRAFFAEQRDLYPYGAPLAPSLIFFWARLVGGSIGRIRLFFALTSVLLMPLGYLLARLFFGNNQASKRAGVIVLICIAFSPVHVFHAQEARMYALVSFFALAGMATMLLALKTGKRRWWWLHWTSNIALVSSHYFTVFLFPVYGIMLLLWKRRFSRTVIAWAAAHAGIAVVLLLWVAAIPEQAEELYSYYEHPSGATVATHILAGDSTTLSATSFFASDRAWYFLAAPLREKVFALRILFDGILILMTVFVLLGGGVVALACLRRQKYEYAWRWLLLLCWALLPVLLITAVSFVWRPVYGSRYVMYSMFAIYLLAGGLIGRLRGRRWRIVVTTAIAMTYAYQLSLALPPQTRTAWRQAYEHFAAHSGRDAILLLEDPFWLPVLQMNITAAQPAPIIAAFKRDTLCEATALIAAISADGSASTTAESWALLVLTTDFDETPFTACLEHNALAHRRIHYPGERNLALYAITPRTATIVPADVDRISLVLFQELAASIVAFEGTETLEGLEKEIRYLPDQDGGFWLRMGITLSRHGQQELASAAFSKAAQTHLHAAMRLVAFAAFFEASLDMDALAEIALNPADGDGCARLNAFLQTAYYTGDSEAIAALGNAALRLEPSCEHAYIYLGLAEHLRGNHEEATQWFAYAPIAVSETPPEIVEAYAIALTETGAYEEAVDLLQAGVAATPGFHWLFMRLGIALAKLDRHEEAVTALQVSHERAPEDSYIIYLLIESLVALKRYEEAARFAEDPAILARTEIWVLLARWRAYTGAGMDDRGERIMGQAVAEEQTLAPFHQFLYGAPDPDAARSFVQSIAPEEPVFPEFYMLLERMER